MVELTAAHWVYAIFIILILIVMAMRRETPLVCIIGSFVLSWVITGNLVKAVQAIFNAITIAASELLGSLSSSPSSWPWLKCWKKQESLRGCSGPYRE